MFCYQKIEMGLLACAMTCVRCANEGGTVMDEPIEVLTKKLWAFTLSRPGTELWPPVYPGCVDTWQRCWALD